VLFASVPVIQPLIDFFEAILKFFHDTLGLHWGWSIILLTLLVRACLLPLTFRQYHSMQKLAHLQPEMKKLQGRFKDDKERLNQEMMKFYRENKVNPLASCLPMVAQLPVFISLYYMLRIDLRLDICGQSADPCGSSPETQFLFIPDITDKATGTTLIVLIVLYVGSQLCSSLLSMSSADRTQRMIFLALPFVFVTFVIRFPAGLLVYWITTNVWTIVQQLIIKKRLGPMRPKPVEGEESPGLFGGLTGLGGGSAATATPSSNGPKTPARDKATARVAGGGAEPKGRASSGPPPASPRKKKKKRSGRRR
jgi:YidC/Oxa1 family membrane protein insertase